jgi:hypothetical protein
MLQCGKCHSSYLVTLFVETGRVHPRPGGSFSFLPRFVDLIPQDTGEANGAPIDRADGGVLPRKYVRGGKMRKIVTAIAALAALAILPAHSHTPSSVLETLPAKVQQDIEKTRAGCREYEKYYDNAPRLSDEFFSGDSGLQTFTLAGRLAVMVDDLKLCGGNCYKGANCTTAGSHMAIYVQSGHSWKIAHADGVRGSGVFLSLDESKDPPAFKAMVVGIPRDSNDCPKHLRSSAGHAFKEACDVIVRWNGSRFTYEALQQ